MHKKYMHMKYMHREYTSIVLCTYNSPMELLTCLVNHVQQQDDMLVLLTELLAQQNKISAIKE